MRKMRKAIVASVISIAGTLLLPALALGGGNAEKGKGLYDQHCASCHGSGGKGDGAAAAALNPKPQDLTNKSFMAGVKDQQLFDAIKNGGAAVGKSPLMPPFGGTLKDGEIQDVIAFVRTLVK